MVEVSFEQSYAISSRIAAVHAANVVARHGLPHHDREDLSQEALLELWRKEPVFDERRAGWRTFADRVVANRLASLVRHMHSCRSGHGKEDPIEGLEIPDVLRYGDVDLRTDVKKVLAGLSLFDRNVALSLIDHSPIETSRRLRVSRATVYRAIDRLRTAFVDAGFSRWRGGRA